MKIRTLNQDSSGSSCFEEICTKEAQEENILKKYNNALKHQFSNQSEEALRVFKGLLKVDIPLMESKGSLSKTLVNLKYSCYLNAANLSVSIDNCFQALEFYDKASEIDNTDITLWYKMGNTAIDLQLYRKAINYFFEGLKHNENHWPCLDKLIVLLYATDDWISCLININKGLQMNRSYGRGLVLRRMIRKINPYSELICKRICPEYIDDDYFNKFSEGELENKIRTECNEFREKVSNFELIPYKYENKSDEIFSHFEQLKSINWISLGESLISIHKKISENKLVGVCG